MVHEYLLPNGVGTDNQLNQIPGFGPHWNKVDDPVGVPDYDLTYVINDFLGATWRLDSYNIQDTAIPDGSTISKIIIRSMCKGLRVWVDGVGWVYGQMQPYIIVGGNHYLGSVNVVWETYNMYAYTYLLNPDTGVAWVKGDLNSLEIGIRLLNLQIPFGTHHEPRCTYIYAHVYYEPPPPPPPPPAKPLISKPLVNPILANIPIIRLLKKMGSCYATLRSGLSTATPAVKPKNRPHINIDL